MGQNVHLLENALRAWEDLRLIDEVVQRLAIRDGRKRPEDLIRPLKDWRELRKHLLNASAPGFEFDFERFCGFANEDETMIQGKANLYQELPLQLASWTASSRRVFSLSEDLVMRFVSADYSHYQWSDLLWPFDSFVINLEQPLVIKGTDGIYRTLALILVSSICKISADFSHGDDRRDGFEIAPYYSTVDGKELPTELLGRKEHAQLDDHLRHKRWEKVDKRKSRLANHIVNALDQSNNELPPGNGDPHLVLKDGLINQGVNVAKIIAGLCLYLEALPGKTVDSYRWHSTPAIAARREVRKVITDGELICQVEDFNVISPNTITLFPETLRAGPAYTVTPHWRRAHYRRAKGQGKNPLAPRDVYVGPSLIHKDQLPEGAVPGGSQSSVR